MARLMMVIASIVALAGCLATPLSTTQTENREIQVMRLFEFEGVTFYAFEDGGRRVYFTKPGTNMQWSHTESCGKNCTKRVDDYMLLGQTPG